MGGHHAFGAGRYVATSSGAHRLPPQCKIVATLAFVIAVVATPREAVWAFAVHAAVLVAAVMVARVPPARVLRHMLIEVPFVLFALLLPFVGRGERVDVAGLSLSIDGSWAAWNILAKATLGVGASALLIATTRVPEILQGLERLRAPRILVAICAFMIRYADVVAGELRRMRIARISRGDDPRWIWQARAVAATAGTLFVRSYERGERVYLAMVSRGYTGALPALTHGGASGRQWFASAIAPVAATAIAGAAWWSR